MVSSSRILVMGATGYIGGRLVPRLAAAGHQVRCMARRPEKLAVSRLYAHLFKAM